MEPVGRCSSGREAYQPTQPVAEEENITRLDPQALRPHRVIQDGRGDTKPRLRVDRIVGLGSGPGHIEQHTASDDATLRPQLDPKSGRLGVVHDLSCDAVVKPIVDGDVAQSVPLARVLQIERGQIVVPGVAVRNVGSLRSGRQGCGDGRSIRQLSE